MKFEPKHKTAKKIFLRAVEMPTSDRISFIENECAGNPGLRSTVAELMAFFENESDSILDTHQMRTALDETTESGAATSFVPGLLDHSGADGDARYLLLDLQGSDAWGDIYRAIQVAPTRRCVSIKTIMAEKPNRAIEQIKIAKCTAATLKHENIVSIFDSGVHEKYNAFLVMEPVEGTVITDYCKQQKWSVRQRLECFIEVCKCLQFMHANGCILRDLEPSNVLIVNDGAGWSPRIINFGVAITFSENRKQMKHLSETRNEFESPAYKAPEQLQLPDSELSQRCDVYSLGVLLFELLTDELPYSSSALAPLEYAEKLRYLCDIAPLPMTFYRNSGFANEIAKWSGTSAKQLNAGFQCDLEPIALKCLNKEPERRYPNVSELISDIERVQAGNRSSVGGKGIGCRVRRWFNIGR